MKKLSNTSQKVLGVLITAAILAGLIAISSKVLKPFDVDCSICAIDAFHDMPENSMDVMIYGSSHAWRGVNALEMYDKYGLATYNYGGNWQRLSTEALFFYDSLRTQKPKIALFETYRIDEIISNQVLDGEIYYTRAISNFPYKEKYLNTAFGDLSFNTLERYVAYYFPLSQFHSTWTDIDVNNFHNWYTKEEFENTLGYYYMPNGDDVVEAKFPEPDEIERLDIEADAEEVLEEILKTCEENDIIPIFFTIPHHDGNPHGRSMPKFAKEHDVVYLDLFEVMDEIGIDPKTDFSDPAHLNNAGAIKVSDYLGEYIRENYEIEDARITKPELFDSKTGAKTGQAKILWDKSHTDEK